jgi:Zn-finger nucleic acid-binding protein
MNCPSCNVTLVMSERQGIEIDYCPNCRGIWLDRGELDKIIEKSSTLGNNQNFQQKDYSDKYHSHGGSYDNDYYKNHKKKNWLNELFD